MPTPAHAAALLQALACPLLQLDAAGCVQWANSAAVQALGDVRGQAFAALWTRPAAAAALHADAPARADLDHADQRQFLAHSQPLPDGGWALTLLPQPVRSEATALATTLTSTTSELQSQLALAVNLGGIAIWRHDLASGRIHANPQGWRALGVPPRAEGMELEELRDLVHPDDRARVAASAEEALRSTQPVDVEARYRHGDGSWHSQLVRRMVLRDAAGQPLAFLGVALDITERREQSRRAEDMQRRFETVTRAAGIGHWLQEPGQDGATWSDQLLAMYGLAPGTPPPTTPRWLADFVHPDDAARVRDSANQWMRSSEQSLELSYRARRADGEVRQLLSHSQREAGAHGPLMFGVVIDLTERHRFEQALKSAQDRVALAARAAGLGTWELDLATGELHWDEQMWRLRGLTPKPVTMSREERLACVHPEDRSRTENLTREALAHGGIFELEFRVLWPDGSTRWLASRSMEINDPGGGGRRRRIGVTWDITDIRTADTVRQEREIALRESASKSKFLARMSHELRTPLNAVLGFAQLLLAEETGHDNAAATRQRRLEHIRAAGQHLLTLINDVLSLSALEGGEVRIALQPVSLQALVAQTMPMLAPLQLQPQPLQPLSITLGALDLHVLADPTRLRQVLLNLLSNAIKYNKPGGSVRVEALRRGASVLLRVADTGRGMSDEQLRHLFEPFNRLGADRGEIEGTGIGLAITKALVERMGGSMHVDSRHGEGSVFELRLPPAVPVAEPAATPPQRLPEAVPSLEPPPQGQHRVLYIEDNPVNALIISELVARRSDLALQIAVDGTRGVQQAQALLPDLILLDMQLPDFDGFEVLRRLQASPLTARIPCIALSANAMPADIERALQAGMADYWTKPLDFKVFLDSLDRLFGKAP